MDGERALRPLAFHEQLADVLEEQEPGLWRWFASDDFGKKYADTVRVELLRSTYRLPRASNDELYRIADEVGRTLALGVPVTLYQAQEEGSLNAGLVFAIDEAHVVLRGPVAQLLSEAELFALFGHELAHHKLWTDRAGRFRTSESLVEHMASHPRSAPSHVQSALRQRRWTEMYCDRGSLLASGDLEAAVACLVKMSTGLKRVDPRAYLAQAAEALGSDAKPATGATHPEAFVRALSLQAWSEGQDFDRVQRFIAGPWELEALDLIQQRELTRVTRELVCYVLAPSFMRSDATLVHARRFFPGLDLDGAASMPQLPGGGDSVAEYVSYLLLDFAMTDPELEDVALPHAAQLAHELDIAAVFAKLARKELRLSAASYAEIVKRAGELAGVAS
jgi:hypothetical protein